MKIEQYENAIRIIAVIVVAIATAFIIYIQS